MMSATLRKVVLAISFAGLGAVTVLAGQAVANSGTPGPGQAQAMGPQKMGKKHKLGFKELVRDLELSPEQMEAAQGIRVAVRQELEQERVAKPTGSVMAAFEAGNPDRDALHAIIDSRMASRAAAAHTVVEGMLDFYELLDEEQKAQVSEKLAKAKTEKPARRGPMMQGPAGKQPSPPTP